MIRDVVRSLVPKDRGVRVEIIVPRGKEIARNTYNPKIGIEGGISIIGTTGMVNPMSDEAWIKTLLLEEQVKRAEGKDTVVFVMGNYGFDFAKNRLGIEEDYLIKISGYVGDALKGASNLGFKKILLIGQVGKMIKVAGGIFNVHNKVADGRFEVLGFYLYQRGFKKEKIDGILKMTSVEEAASIIINFDKEFFSYIANKVSKKITFYIGTQDIQIGSIIYSLKMGYLGSTDNIGSISRSIFYISISKERRAIGVLR